MKKLFLCGLFSLSALLTLNGQTLWVPGGTSGIGDNTTNSYVGIGTTSVPADKLHVVGRVRIGASDDTDQNILAFYRADGTTYSTRWVYNSGSDTYYSMYNTSGTTMVRLHTNGYSYLLGGRFGLGTAAPLSSLDVRGPAGSIELARFFNSDYTTNIGSGIRIYTGASSGDTYTGIQAYDAGATSTNDLILQSGGGNIGIGISTPEERLHINGALALKRGLFTNWISGSTIYDPRIYSSGNGGTAYPFLTTGNLILQPRVSGAGFDIIFATHNGTSIDSRLVVKSSGNVLIGKTSQTNSTYKLDVAGKIRADEVVVNTTGADFVFDPDYRLLNLSEVEQFIKQYKHLTDIPPSTEMQENGVNVSKLQTKLLQKIEELTLYVIELNKRIETLESERKISK